MFIVEWMFDKMGYTKKVDWTSRFLAWEDVEPPKKRIAKKKPAAKKTVKSRAKKD
jgi:hypothetical protein